MKLRNLLTVTLADGNVISLDAPRPSSEDIRELLDVNL